MAAKKQSGNPHKDGEHESIPIDEATDGASTSRLEKAIKDAPDKPAPSTIAQVQELHEEEPGA